MVKDGVGTFIDDAVAEVVLDLPPVNAVTTGMYVELTRVFNELSNRVDVQVILLRSAAARGFSAGADVKEQVAAASPAEPADVYRQRLATTCYDAIMDCAQPSIAVVHGFALGAGTVIAACCDIRYAADTARIGLPEINVGRCGGGRHLMRLIPQGKTRLMYFTGEPIAAEEAMRLDLVQGVFPAERVLEEARSLARTIAGKSPLGLRLAKRALNESESMEVKAGYRHEQTYTLRLGRHPDAREAVRATLERRPPVWTRAEPAKAGSAQSVS